MTDTSFSIVLTESNIDSYFDEQDDFFDIFEDNEEKEWIITLNDLKQIQEIDPSAFVHIKEKFIKEIRKTEPTLDDFLRILVAGIHLIDSSECDNFQKAMHHGETENYFQIQLDGMFLKVFCKREDSFIKQDAFLHGRQAHSDYILYDSNDTSDYLLIEHAANISTSSMNEHLNRLIKVYPDQVLEFKSIKVSTEVSKKRITLYANPEKMWFIYFDHDYKKLRKFATKIEEDENYHILNVLFCHYNLSKDTHLEKHFKITGEANFVHII